MDHDQVHIPDERVRRHARESERVLGLLHDHVVAQSDGTVNAHLCPPRQIRKPGHLIVRVPLNARIRVRTGLAPWRRYP
jgi:hypothetical protein